MSNSTNLQLEKKVTVFAGKGGVGKTTCAAATALHYAIQGQRTLCISTDPTPSLSHIFEVKGHEKPANPFDSLFIQEIGLKEVKEMWDKRFGKEVYEVFSSFVSIDYEHFTEFMTSVLPGLSDEFIVDYIREICCQYEYDVVVWDTAPLGQTLALLRTPALLVDHLKLAPRIYSKLRTGRKSKEPILDILRRWEKLSALNMDFLMKRVKFVIVAIPEALAVNQLDYIVHEMGKYNLNVEHLILNNRIKADGSEFLSMKAEQQKFYLDQVQKKYSALRIVELSMFPHEIKGIDSLKKVAELLIPN